MTRTFFYSQTNQANLHIKSLKRSDAKKVSETLIRQLWTNISIDHRTTYYVRCGRVRAIVHVGSVPLDRQHRDEYRQLAVAILNPCVIGRREYLLGDLPAQH